MFTQLEGSKLPVPALSPLLAASAPGLCSNCKKCRTCFTCSQFIMEGSRTELVSGFSSSPLVKHNEQKESRREAEQKRWEQLLSEQYIWPLLDIRGDLSCAHPKLLDFHNPLHHVSTCLLGPKISHFKNISYPSGKLGPSTLLLKLQSG